MGYGLYALQETILELILFIFRTAFVVEVRFQLYYSVGFSTIHEQRCRNKIQGTGALQRDFLSRIET